jgi:hypothetical protein
MGWWLFRSKEPAPEAEAQEKTPPETETPQPVADRLLEMQQKSDDQTVREMLAQSPGEPLDHEVQRQVESQFPEDLSAVRVHTDVEAASSTEALGTRAYTAGRDIYFAKGMYAPKSPEGRHLLAHELAHVVQQDRTTESSASLGEVSKSTDAAESEAETVAHATARGERAPEIISAGKGLQKDVGWAKRGPFPDPYGILLLLNSFAGKFLEAAKLIYKNPTAMKLVNEAEAAGVQFGGYAEDGPAKDIGRAYTAGSTVYVPKTETDPVLAMRDFLFELNNALRAPKVAELVKEAAKGSKGTVTAKQHAYNRTEQEVEGMLRLGEIWFETKKTMPKGPKTNIYDAPFFLPDYLAVKSGKKTKDDLVKEVLKRVYDTGTLKGKTVEQYYIDEYNRVSGGK